MIPFFQFDFIHLGPVVIHVWGLLVALGIIAGITFAYFLSKKYLLSGEVILDMGIWALVGAFIMARVFYVVFYNPAYFVANPMETIKLWHGGASSLGGFVGAGLSLWLFAKKRHFTFKELLPYFDIGALGFWLGWGIGRIGCFLIHDHPGTLTHFILGVKFPDGARFDLGLMESILGFILFITFYLLFKKLIKIRFGLVAGYSVASYAVARFFLDFLRATPDFPGGDVRYSALTPAQWGMLAVLVGLTSVLVLSKMKRTNGEVA
ncbi:MAG: Prolipoprotein diacylglyceryl transferase [Parcubacteria group bacterium Gr01-1014_13]|nr:MAG: Prolipoprotein diacylglyceryl transferase [Parcubacteria group bacterium Gr01-1014_13]